MSLSPVIYLSDFLCRRPYFLNNSGLFSLSGMAPFHASLTTRGPLLSLPNHFPAFKITFQLFPLLIFPSSVLSNTGSSSSLTSQLFPNPLALSSFLLSSLISLDPDAHHFIHTLTNTLHSLPTAKSWQNSKPDMANYLLSSEP